MRLAYNAILDPEHAWEQQTTAKIKIEAHKNERRKLKPTPLVLISKGCARHAQE